MVVRKRVHDRTRSYRQPEFARVFASQLNRTAIDICLVDRIFNRFRFESRRDVMYRKIQLSFLAIIFLLCLSLEFGADAQLNFSTGWGKRNQRVAAFEQRASGDCLLQARPSLEQLLAIYNIIQTEARKMMDCRKLYE